jgi:putative ABC transport system permease protein
MSTLPQDLRVAVRQLAAHPGFVLIVVVTLALGIGATTTCFAVLNGVAYKPLPFADPDRLIAVNLADRQTGRWSRPSLDTFTALQQANGVWSAAAAYDARLVSVAGAGIADRVQGAEVSNELFAVLGVPVQLGRPFAAGDAGTRVAMISHDLWVSRFGASADAIGTTLSIDGDAFTVIGVAGRGFSFPENSRVWMPLDTATPPQSVDVVARLAPGVSPAQAATALTAALAALPSVQGEPPDRKATTTSLRQRMIGTKQRNMAAVVLTAAALVLLVACGNLAGILTAYVDARKHEMAVRAAIGAGRGRLLRQLMTESVMLALAGGTLGLLLAQWGVDLFSASVGKPQGADWLDLAVDGHVVLFALSAALVTALLFGLAPAIKATRVDLRGVLQEDKRTSGPGPRSRRVRGLLVAGQVALSIALVSAAAAIVESSIGFENVDVGFDRKGVLGLRVALSGRAYAQPEQRFAFVDAAVERLRTVPGVVAVTAGSHLPLMDRDVPHAGFVVDGSDVTGAPPYASVRFVDAGYLAAMDIPVRRGRAFTVAEARSLTGRAIMINETMARRYWNNRDPINTRVRLIGAPDVDGWYTVVGIVGEVSQRQLPADPENQMYLPLAPASELTLMVRAAADPGTIAGPLRDAVQSIDPSVPVTANTMNAVYGWYTRDRRLQGVVIGVLGVIAMLLAALGVYATMSLLVTERRREIAIRMALGSSNRAILRLVLGRGLSLTSVGVGAGVLLACAFTAFLSSIFLGLRAFNPAVVGSAAALLATVAIVASWWPARRGMQVDPLVTLNR